MVPTATSLQILNIFPINSKLCIKMGKIWCSISNHQIINKHIPLSLLDKHSEAIHSLFPTLTHRVEVRPFQNQQFWCYFCHPIVNFLVWDLYDCNEKILFSVLHISYCFLHKKQDHPKIYSTITTVIKIIIVKIARVYLFLPPECWQYFSKSCYNICWISYHIEWLWQKSRAEMIWRKNLRASFGVNLPFLTR